MPAGGRLCVAIVGGGAAGSTLATLLANAGARVVLLHDGRRPPLLVGESLVPAIVPILQRLGVEDQVAAIGVRKPGVTFHWSSDDRFQFSFGRFPRRFPPYAYNVPRPAFDDILLARARAAGVTEVGERTGLTRRGADAVELTPATLAAAALERQPDLIVDASGRARVLGRLLALPTREGPRNDVAHFAHFAGFDWREPGGQVLLTRLASGWSWRIPLRDRLSLGIVLGRDAAAALGASPEDRLQHAIAVDPALAADGRNARRLSPVVTYSNYELVTERAHGPGWTLVGDAFGFVDPMLSPGVFLALHAANRLTEALRPAIRRTLAGRTAGDLQPALASYSAHMHHVLSAWMELVAHVYGGTLLGLYRAGSTIVQRWDSVLTRAMEHHVGSHIAAMASGTATTSPYSRRLLRFLSRHGMAGIDPAAFAVH